MTYQEIATIFHSLKSGDTVEITYHLNNQLETRTHVVDQSWEGMQRMFPHPIGSVGGFTSPVVTLQSKNGERVTVFDWEQGLTNVGTIRDHGKEVWWCDWIGHAAKPVVSLRKM